MSELETGGASAPAPDTSAPVIDTAPPPVAENTLPTMDETLEAAWDKSQTGNDRGDSGRFESDKPAEPENKDLAVQPPTGKVEPETPPAQAAPTIDPPNSWAAEARAHWAKLPPEAQEYILKREGEAHKAITWYGERVKSFEPIDKVITHFKPHFDRHGIQPAQSFAALLEAQSALDRNPVEGLINIARTYGIDLGALLNGQQSALPDPRVGQVEQRLNHIQQTIEQQRQQQEQAQFAEVSALIDTFKKDHPHFDSVEDELMGLIPVMRQRHVGLSNKELLEKAYDSATYANPEIRKRIQEDQRVADEKTRRELAEKADLEAKAKAEAAKKAAKLNAKGSIANPSNKTMDDTLDEIARRAYG